MIKKRLPLLVIVTWFLWPLCSCTAIPTGPDTITESDTVIDPMIEHWWAVAKSDLDEMGIRYNDVPASTFHFEAIQGPFDCGGVKQTQGCFSPSNQLIRYGIGHEYTIRHEGHHALLWISGDARWRCVGHSCIYTELDWN